MEPRSLIFRQIKPHLFPRIAGLWMLFSGVALVTHILAGISLRWALVFTGSLVGLGIFFLWRRASPPQRSSLVQYTRVGLLSGLLATLTYDVTKYGLSQLDPTPYNPFEVLRVFGLLLAGPGASPAVILGAGTAFHLLNGTCFGIAFCFFLGRRGIIPGIFWGVFLEMFQLTLYPGWLDIRFYREFVQISALSHIVYGAVLGVSCRAGLLAGRARSNR